MTVVKNGTSIGTVTVIASSYYYAATVSGNPGDLAVWANAGQTPIKYPGSGGWFHFGIGLTPFFLSTLPYIAAPTDSYPNQKFSGDIDRMQNPITVARSVTFWPWGSSAPSHTGSGGQIQIDILDPDQKYNQLMTLDIRDQLVSISRLYQGAALSTAEPILTAVIDHCDQTSDQTKTLFCYDKIVTLQSQLVRPLFPPNADPAVAGKPRPISLGICRTYIPALYDSVNLRFAASDETISAVGKGREQGKELGYGIDYTILPDGQGFSKAVAPAGQFTIETTSFGGAFSSASTDLLVGDGVFGSTTDYGGGLISTSGSPQVTSGVALYNFNTAAAQPFHVNSHARVTSRGSLEWMQGQITAYSGTTLTIQMSSNSGTASHSDWDITGGVRQPTNWTGNGHYYPPDDPKDTVWQLGGIAPNKTVTQVQNPSSDGIYRLKHNTLTLAPGTAYAYEVVVVTCPSCSENSSLNFVDGNGNPTTVLPAYLAFGGENSSNLVFKYFTRFPIVTPGTFHGSFVNTSSLTVPLVFGIFQNNALDNSSSLVISSIKLVALPALTQNIVLDGPGLDLMLRDLIVTHGPMELTDYDATGAVAIDTLTGYKYGLHVSENETPSVAAAVRKVLDTACADIYFNRAGKVSALRLTAPEAATSITGSLTVTDFQGYLKPYPDNAENLTTRMSGCKNYDPYAESDFSNITQSDVPQIVRKQLEQNFQWTVTANSILSPKYQYAQNTQPLESQLDRQEHGQAEITRVNKLYATPRYFYEGQVFTEIGRLLEIGQIWNVTYPMGSLTAGQQLMVVGLSEQPSEQLTTVTFWGN